MTALIYRHTSKTAPRGEVLPMDPEQSRFLMLRRQPKEKRNERACTN